MYADVSAVSPYVTLNNRRSHNLETERADSAGRLACLRRTAEAANTRTVMKGYKTCHSAIRPNSCRPIRLHKSLLIRLWCSMFFFCSVFSSFIFKSFLFTLFCFLPSAPEEMAITASSSQHVQSCMCSTCCELVGHFPAPVQRLRKIEKGNACLVYKYIFFGSFAEPMHKSSLSCS